MIDALRLQALHRRNGRVDRIAIVCAPSSIQTVVDQTRRPRTEATAPALEFRLLVEVAVHQHGRRVRAVRAGSCDLEEQRGRAAREPDDFHLEAWHLLRADPVSGLLDHPLQEPGLCPLRVEQRRLGRYGDVVGQPGNQFVVPGARDVGQRADRVEVGDSGVHRRTPSRGGRMSSSRRKRRGSFGTGLVGRRGCLPQASQRIRLRRTPSAALLTSTISPFFSAGTVGPSQPNQITSPTCSVRYRLMRAM